MKKVIFTLAIIFTATALKAQVAFSFHHSPVQSSFGISTNPERTIWFETRLNILNIAMGKPSDFDVTAMLMANFLERKGFDLYAGFGFDSVFQKGLFKGNFYTAFGFQLRPIEGLENFSLFSEYTPSFYVKKDGKGLGYRGGGSIGIRYFLRK